VARQISKCRIHNDPNTGEWIHPPLANALFIAGLLPLSEYIQNRRKYLLPWAAQSVYFIRADNLDVVSIHHDVFIGHLKGPLKK
jgi:hypothetical protein